MTTISASIIGSTFITLMMGSKVETINSSHPNYGKIRDAIKIKNLDLVEQLLNISAAIEKYSNGSVEVKNGGVYWNGQPLHNSLVDRILVMLNEGFDIDPMVRFLENLMENPSKRAVDELYGFLEAAKLPITEDGHFLAYKKVNSNYLDFYTGKMDNSVGKVLKMPRNAVDEDANRTCSEGLHFCAFSYLRHYHGGAGRVVILKINPRDVFAIPIDYNNAKGRACEYTVIGEHEGHDTKPTFEKAPVYKDSQTPAEPVRETTTLANAYDRGYAAGQTAYETQSEYDPLVLRNEKGIFVNQDYRTSYAKGYKEGWNDAQVEDSVDEPTSDDAYRHGYERAEWDLEYGNPFTTSVYRDPAGKFVNADYRNNYATGYADGWTATSKRASLSSTMRTEVDELYSGQTAYDRGFSDAVNGNNYAPNSKDPHVLAEYSRGWSMAKNY